MAIIGQNTLLNQYVPTFVIKDLLDGQTLVYDSTRRAFVNSEGSGPYGASKLGELLNVSSTVDSPSLSLHTGQALVYNSSTSLWENSFVDYNTLLNKPATGGSVTTVSVITDNGISGVVANPTTTPAITLTLGDITPTGVAATGTITGSNLSGSSHGTNTGDQTITLTGDVTGSGTGSFATTLATVPIAKGGTGQTIASDSFRALAPPQTISDSGNVLTADGLGNVSWIASSGGTSVGSIKSFQATVSLAADATVAIGTAMPARSTVLSVKVLVTATDPGATLSVGSVTDGVEAFMTTSENDPQTAGIYLAETYFTIGASEIVNATVASSSGIGSGSCKVIFTYQVA